MLLQGQHAHTSALRAMYANLQKRLQLTSINHTMYSTCFLHTSALSMGTTLDMKWKDSQQKGPSTYLAHTMLLIRM